MAEENIENQEQTNEEKVQHSLGEVIQLLGKIQSINIACSVTSKALHSKQKKIAKAQLREQAKAEAIVVCEKYKTGKEAQVQMIQEIQEYYEDEFEKIAAEFEQKCEANREEHEKNDSEYDELVLKEADARKAYKQEKKSKEYKDFIAVNKEVQKQIEFYENNKDIAPENVKAIVAELKKLSSKNPLNKYAEELKKIEDRKKEIITANKELEAQLTNLENNFEKMWDELEVNKNKALVDAKNNNLIKPTLGQRLSNFFSSQAKRREKAKVEAKQKREKRIEDIKNVGGIIGTGVVNGVTKVKTSIKEWYKNIKLKGRENINTLFENLSAKYEAKEEEMSNLHEEVDKYAQEHAAPVPKGESPIIENDESTIIETEESKTPARPGNSAGKKPEVNKKPTEGPEPEDR